MSGVDFESESVCEVDECGDKFWYQNGELGRKLHRVGGPAVEFVDGSVEWWLNDERHREDGPAVEYAGGYKAWYLDGWLHRVDGPAIEHCDGCKEWWFDGERHRVDGPAVVCSNGSGEWWFCGVCFDGVEFLLDVFIGIEKVRGVDGDWCPEVLVVDGFVFGR